MKYFLLFLLFFSSFSLAGEGTKQSLISKVYVASYWAMVRVPDISANPGNCRNTSYYAINPDDRNYESLHSLLLAAYVAGKEVSFWVHGCGGQGNNHPKIISVISH